MPQPTSYHFSLPTYQGPILAEPASAWYPGVRQHYAHCTSDRTLHSDGRIRTFVIHATAGSSSAGAMSVLFNHSASWHWLIPDENEQEHGSRFGPVLLNAVLLGTFGMTVSIRMSTTAVGIPITVRWASR